MIHFDFERLQSMGLNAAVTLQAALQDKSTDAAHEAGSTEPALHLMRLTELHRETVHVHDGLAERSARVLPRLMRQLEQSDTALAVGDWVAPDWRRQWRSSE